MAVLINGQIGVSLGYQWGVKQPKTETVYYFPTMKEAEKIAGSIPGASVVMREAYATEWMETL
jgi:hypothetical protein